MREGMTPVPVRRRVLRLWLGTRYFRARRWVWWRLGGVSFARRRTDPPCPYRCAAHATPLMRRFKDVDMWMQENKVKNLRLAVARLDGMTLLPGETLSYWRSIGNPSRRKGYVEGMLLRNGQVVPGVGGGLCQCSNLLYWMTLHTPLMITERHRHGYDVFPDADRTQPFGSGATCFYNYLDLMIRNDTPHVWRLSLRVMDAELVGAWQCSAPQAFRYEVYEKEHRFQGEYWGGYTRHNVLFRRVFDMEGVPVGEELVCENHAIMMYSPMLSERKQAARPQE